MRYLFGAAILCQLSRCAEQVTVFVEPTLKYTARFSGAMDGYLKANESDRAMMTGALDKLFRMQAAMALSDSEDNFEKTLMTGVPDWIECFIGLNADRMPLELDSVFGTPDNQLGSGQRSFSRYNFFAFTESVGQRTLEGIERNQAWDWWLYKTVRGLDAEESREAIEIFVGQIRGDFASAVLVGTDLHVWRHGRGVFVNLGVRDGSDDLVITFPLEQDHQQTIKEFADGLMFSTVPVRAGDILVYLSGSAAGELEFSELQRVLQQACHDPELLESQVFDYFQEHVLSHYAGHRLEVFRIKPTD